MMHIQKKRLTTSRDPSKTTRTDNLRKVRGPKNRQLSFVPLIWEFYWNHKAASLT